MELTRKVIILESTEDMILDYNYHYELMKEIYRAIELENKNKAEKLHNRGFIIENKRYKLFTNQLFIKDAEYLKEGIVISKNSKLKLTISGAKDIVNDVILGIVQNKQLKLFNNIFKVLNLENEKRIKFDSITLYRVRNPIVASIQNEKRQIVFMSPYQDKFFEVLANNLRRKYRLIYNKDYQGELYFDIEDIFSIKKRLISNIKTKGVVIGYSNFELYVQADVDMQKVAYYCGVGSNNSLGMGMMTYITSRRD
ncbi:MAG: CRISPR-associated endoribonuclease Cas6 [Terrisporobacter sp.]